MKIERKYFLIGVIVLGMTSVFMFNNYYEYVKYFSQVFVLSLFFTYDDFINLFSIISSRFLWKCLYQIMIKMLMSCQERLQIKPDAPFILTSVKSCLVIHTGKYLPIMVQFFIFMGHTLVEFAINS